MRKIFLSVLLASAAFGFASAEKYAEIDGLWYWMDAGTQIAKPCKATQVWPVPEGMTYDDLSNTVMQETWSFRHHLNMTAPHIR